MHSSDISSQQDGQHKKSSYERSFPSIHQVLMVVDDGLPLKGEFSMLGLKFTCVSFGKALDTTRELVPDAILVLFNANIHFDISIHALKNLSNKNSIPIILYSKEFDIHAKETAVNLGFDDYYFGNFTDSLLKKFHIIRKSKQFRMSNRNYLKFNNHQEGRYWLPRRVIDVVVSSVTLIVLSPVLLLIALIIKLESRGPVFYISKRAGSNYRIFDFIKFRSMHNGADSQLQNLSNKNQYGSSLFVKIKEDPRVTPFGRFLRKTSLDEVPQLINVLKGDMSLVGNRPLPLYEAKELTKDETALRFLAPAGVTGLWQITKRGGSEMSETERINLDIIYARKYSLFYDLRLLVNTIPALLQKEAV